MNSRALRRLAADHGALHNQELPPNYLFPTGASTDDLTQLDLLLTGPSHTPFSAGVWKLHLSIPPTYPQQPPVANFRTPIFHPNVDPQTGGVCVETLKRDWDSKLTLRDVLVTISCLLIQPNPDSALNAEAGALLQEDYEAFARRATLMTSIHAAVPKTLHTAVRDAQNRGQEEQTEDANEEERNATAEAPVRRRRTIAKVRSNMRRAEESPTGRPPQRRQPQSQPFVFQSGNDDVFGISTRQPERAMSQIEEDDDSIQEGEQENDLSRPPTKAATPAPAMTPRRPRGVPVPLGELILDQMDPDTSEEMESEYPPSPSKSSPMKSPAKRRQARDHDSSDINMSRPESSRDAALRGGGFNTTPPNITDKPLFEDSQLMDITFERSVSPRKPRRGLFGTPPKRPGKGGLLFGSFGGGDVISSTPEMKLGRGILKPRSPSSAERRREEEQKSAVLDAKLWALCGGDMKRWNRGDFDGEPFKKKAGRW